MCTVEKQGNLYILTITGNNEHRLNPTLINTIHTSLTQIKSQYNKTKTPSALITKAHGKFFSNGYDLAWANSTQNPTHAKHKMDVLLQSLVHELLTFPMPTIAAVTGHAVAAGMMLAMVHDYVVMRGDRGWLYMSELDIGLVIPEWFMKVLRSKIVGSKERVKVVLAAVKMNGEMGREIGVVDEVREGVIATVARAVEIGEELVGRGWDGGVYGEIRKGLYRDALEMITGGNNGVRPKL